MTEAWMWELRSGCPMCWIVTVYVTVCVIVAVAVARNLIRGV